MDADEKFGKALRRNLSELQRVLYYRRAWGALKSTDRLTSGLDVFELMDRAFFDQMVAHAIKVFDRSRRVASFWYLLRQQTAEIEQFCRTRACTLHCIEVLSAKLKIIRNKTHFHIDGDCVSDPKGVWTDAGVVWNEFDQATQRAFEILQHLYTAHHGQGFEFPSYDGSDVADLIRLAEHNGLSVAWADRFC